MPSALLKLILKIPKLLLFWHKTIEFYFEVKAFLCYKILNNGICFVDNKAYHRYLIMYTYYSDFIKVYDESLSVELLVFHVLHRR